MGVLVSVFNNNEEDLEGKEQALLVSFFVYIAYLFKDFL